MALNAQFAATPRIGIAEVATADTATRTTPTQVATVITGVAAGTRISKIIVQGAGTTVAGIVRLWLFDNTSYRLFKEVPISAATTSATATVPQVILSEATDPDLLPITLPGTTWSLRATVTTTQTSSGINVIAVGADL